MFDPKKNPIRAVTEKRKWLAGYAEILKGQDPRVAEADAEIDEMERRLALFPELVDALTAAYIYLDVADPNAPCFDQIEATLARAKGAQQ